MGEVIELSCMTLSAPPPKRKRVKLPSPRFIDCCCRLTGDLLPLVVASGAEELHEVGVALLRLARSEALLPQQEELLVAIARVCLSEASELALEMEDDEPGPGGAA